MTVRSARRAARRTAAIVGAGAAVLLAVGISVAGAQPAQRPAPAVSDQRQKDFAAAAREFGVPADLLLAVSATLTGWAEYGGRPSAAGGYGPMHLLDPAADTPDRRDGGPATARPATGPAAVDTLAAAARLAGVTPEAASTDPRQNIRAGAQRLPDYALRANAAGRRLPTTVIGWYGAVAQYGTGGDPMTGRSFADDVLETLRRGVPATVVDRQALRLPAHPEMALPQPPGARGTLHPTEAPGATECPAELRCRAAPAAYARTGAAGDPPGYGTFDPANRPADGNEIRQIVLANTSGTAATAILAAQQPASRASTHYVVRSADGRVTQLVRTADVAWHAANWSVNATSIGIAVEPAGPGGAGYSEAAYRSTARLVRYLADRYAVPLDRQHIVGLGEIPAVDAAGDPADRELARWDWARFMTLLGAPIVPEAYRAERIVTFARTAGPLRTAPRADAPKVPGAGPAAGRSYAVTERSGEWTAIWYGGRVAWFRDADGTLALGGSGATVTAAPGRDRIPVYPRAYPEATAFPAGVGPPALTSGPDTIAAGQAYVLVDPVPSTYFHATFAGEGRPTARAVIEGDRRYVLINFGARQAYVDADDVALAGLVS